MLRKRKEGVLLQIYSLTFDIEPSNSSSSSDFRLANPKLLKILQTYEEIFQKLKGLPPFRTQDRRIPLKPGSKLICVRPYIYPYYQKK